MRQAGGTCGVAPLLPRRCPPLHTPITGGPPLFHQTSSAAHPLCHLAMPRRQGMAKEAVDDLDLVALDVELRRLVRRARRQRRGAEGGPAQWQVWSGTTDEAFCLVDQITGTPALGLDGLSVKIGALRWFRDPGDDPALHHAAAEPPLHRRYPRQEAGGSRRAEESRRYRRAQHLGTAAVVEAERMAGST